MEKSKSEKYYKCCQYGGFTYFHIICRDDVKLNTRMELTWLMHLNMC